MIMYLTMFTFTVMVVTAGVLYGFWYLADTMDWYNTTLLNLRIVVFILFVASCIIASVIVRVFGNRFLFKNIRALSEASQQVATGDFSVRLPIPKERELGALTANFNEMVEQLGRQEMLANDFISNVSHEFRNPLSAIRGYAQLLDSDNLTGEERQEYRKIIEEKALGLSTLVTNILELSRLENHSSACVRQTFSLDEQIRQCVLFSEPAWGAKTIDMDVSLAPVRFEGSKELLAEVWQNLIDNAVKFTPDGGNIRVSLEDADACVVVRVSDNGTGMDAQTCSRIFDKFYQGDHSQSGQGNGLGLSIVKKIVCLHNGSITVSSQPGRGTEMKVTLPKVSR